MCNIKLDIYNDLLSSQNCKTRNCGRNVLYRSNGVTKHYKHFINTFGLAFRYVVWHRQFLLQNRKFLITVYIIIKYNKCKLMTTFLFRCQCIWSYKMTFTCSYLKITPVFVYRKTCTTCCVKTFYLPPSITDWRARLEVLISWKSFSVPLRHVYFSY